MKKQNDWVEVDERFDMKFWPWIKECQKNKMSLIYSDSGTVTKKALKSFLHSELEKVRQETIEEIEQKVKYGVPRFLKGGEIRNQYFVKGWNECREELLTNLKSK